VGEGEWASLHSTRSTAFVPDGISGDGNIIISHQTEVGRGYPFRVALLAPGLVAQLGHFRPAAAGGDGGRAETYPERQQRMVAQQERERAAAPPTRSSM
jgi:hypothetical protein